MGAPARAQAKPSTDGPRDAAQHRRGRHDQLHPVAELDGSGNLVSRFVWASKKNTPDLVITAGVTYRVLTDQLGSPRALVDTSAGTIAGVMRHDAWGVVLEDSVSTLMPFGFAGGLYDAETGLVRFGARDYDASIGRWVSKDPIRFRAKEVNLYSYAGNEPINRYDLLGTDWKDYIRPLNAARSWVSLFGLAGALQSPDENLRNVMADECNRRYYEDEAHTQSQDTYGGGQSIDPYEGGMSGGP